MTAPQRMLFRNCHEHPLEFVLEPWGMPLELPPSATIDILVDGALGPPELDLGERRVVLYCASGSRIVAAIDGAEVYSTLDGLAVPATPGGSSVRGFVTKLFGR